MTPRVLWELQLEMGVADAGPGGEHSLRCPKGVCLKNIGQCTLGCVWQKGVPLEQAEHL